MAFLKPFLETFKKVYKQYKFAFWHAADIQETKRSWEDWIQIPR